MELLSGLLCVRDRSAHSSDGLPLTPTETNEQPKFGHVNTIYTDKLQNVYQDMNRPFSHYFISSGHNSYLLGNQLIGRCGVETIVDSLRKGCRVIELDCWDSRDGPSVYHGHTLTLPVDFRECVTAIKDNSFVSTPFPVILTIENHCNLENQDIMAAILEEVLSDVLYHPTGNLPCPVDLKHKIIFRGKIMFKTVQAKRTTSALDIFSLFGLADNTDKISNQGTNATDNSNDNDNLVDQPQPQQHSHHVIDDGANVEDDSDDGESGDDSDDDKPADQDKPKSPPRAAPPALGVTRRKSRLSLIVGLENVRLDLDKKYPPNSSKSASKPEKALKKLAKSPAKVINYTTQNVVRIYPKGSRIDSSNFDPSHAWWLGCQIAALNWQSWDLPVHTNVGKFRDNGSSGYVLKPDWMLSQAPDAFDPNNLPVQKVLHVHIMEGINILESSILPKAVAGLMSSSLFVSINLFGLPKDTTTTKTKVIDAADVCTFDERFEFPLRSVELGILVVSLTSSSLMFGDSHVAHMAFPMNNIREGEFLVPMLNEKCNTFPVPEKQQDGDGDVNRGGEVYRGLALRIGMKFETPL